MRSAKRGSVIDVTISPSTGFWIGMSPAFLLLAYIPLALLMWLINLPIHPGSPLFGIILIPFFGLMCLWWLWGLLLSVTYPNIPRYRNELSDLLDHMSDRWADGLPVLEAADTPEQIESKRKLHIKAAQKAAMVLTAFFALMGSGLFSVGVKGWSTERLTLHVRSKSSPKHNESRSVTLTGPQAVTTAKGMVSFGAGLAVAGG